MNSFFLLWESLNKLYIYIIKVTNEYVNEQDIPANTGNLDTQSWILESVLVFTFLIWVVDHQVLIIKLMDFIRNTGHKLQD